MALGPLLAGSYNVSVVYYENGAPVGNSVGASFPVTPAIPTGLLPALIATGAGLLFVSRRYLRHSLA